MSGPTSPTVEPSAETVSEKTSPAPNLNNTVNGTNVTLINETNIGNTTRHKRAVDASQNQKDNTKPTPLPGRVSYWPLPPSISLPPSPCCV